MGCDVGLGCLQSSDATGDTSMQSGTSGTGSSDGSESGDEAKELLLASKDLSSYPAQFKFYIPSKMASLQTSPTKVRFKTSWSRLPHF